MLLSFLLFVYERESSREQSSAGRTTSLRDIKQQTENISDRWNRWCGHNEEKKTTNRRKVVCGAWNITVFQLLRAIRSDFPTVSVHLVRDCVWNRAELLAHAVYASSRRKRIRCRRCAASHTLYFLVASRWACVCVTAQMFVYEVARTTKHVTCQSKNQQ